ncbi:MAG: YdeI/OmpD-associated family protein [Pseudomonadota bacterium]
MQEPEAGERFEITGSDALWHWLAQNHDRPDGLWLVTWKKAADRDRYVSRDAVLDALIAHGWVDGRRMVLDDERTMQWISPRRRQVWARTYKQRAERLEAEGRMQPAGAAAVEAGRASGLWTASDPVDDLLVPADLRAALRTRQAETWFDGSAPSYRRNVLRWIAGAKGAATRESRIDIVTAHAARQEKVPNY